MPRTHAKPPSANQSQTYGQSRSAPWPAWTEPAESRAAADTRPYVNNMGAERGLSDGVLAGNQRLLASPASTGSVMPVT